MNFHKIILLFSISVTFFSPRMWAQKKNSPFRPELNYTGDFFGNFTGGIKTGYTYLGKLHAGFNFSTDEAGWWKNGTLHTVIENTHGGLPSGTYAGDLQMLSNIENGNHTYLFECWYSQKIGHLVLLAGLHDMNSVFANVDIAGTLINSSFGIMPDISLNMPVSIFPKTSPGLLASYSISPEWTIATAVYNGNPGDLQHDPHNTDFHLNKRDGYFSITEIQFTGIVSARQEITVKAGSYYHSGNYPHISDSSVMTNGNYGFYLLGSAKIYFPGTDRHRYAGLFIQSGRAPEVININSLYVGAGIVCKGLLAKRPDDMLALAAGRATMGSDYLHTAAVMADNESMAELTWQYIINDKLSVQPDLQYIIHPGAEQLTASALSGIIRFQLNIGQ